MKDEPVTEYDSPRLYVSVDKEKREFIIRYRLAAVLPWTEDRVSVDSTPGYAIAILIEDLDGWIQGEDH